MSKRIIIDCDAACASKGRRQFIVAGSTFLLTAAALGLSSGKAVALPVSFAGGSGAEDEKRYPIPAGDGVTIDRTEQVILVRYQSHVYAFALSCPHENSALKWLPKDGRFQCTKHQSEYTPVGVYTTGRATRNMDRFAIKKDDASVVVNLTKWFRSDQDAAGWNAANVSL